MTVDEFDKKIKQINIINKLKNKNIYFKFEKGVNIHTLIFNFYIYIFFNIEKNVIYPKSIDNKSLIYHYIKYNDKTLLDLYNFIIKNIIVL